MNKVRAGAMLAFMLALGGCGPATTVGPALNGANSAALIELPVPIVTTQTDANGSASVNAVQPAPAGLQASVAGRWSPPGAGCEQAVEFRADGMAIRRPGAPPDRWAVERVDGRDVLRVDADGGSERMVIESAGSRLVLVDARQARFTLIRC